MIEIVIFSIMLIWFMASLGALCMSLICFGYEGSGTNNVIGLVVALLLGPFYWIYYAFNKSYCR